ncbi:auxin transport protein BIG isoform X2 [Ananas comosus]|uniref:Auxin transport protein BIG n=1 Tax=Ananas comosus TaxID=4615 RepID=A0A6P5G4R4_ANACO|nr:auxin transport protein BIG isoform X2 [Ananas comosus]
MAEIAGLVEILGEERAPKDLASRLRSDAARPGLRRLLAVLASAADAAADAAAAADGSESWTRAQIDAVVAAARAIASAVLFASVEQVEPAVATILGRSVEFCISYLERSAFDGSDLGLQNELVQFLELALANATSKECDVPDHCPVNISVEQLSSIPVKAESMDMGSIENCYLQGFKCSKDENVTASLLVSLSSESSWPVPLGRQSTETLVTKSPNFMMSVLQHHAIVHLKCVPHLLMLCKELLRPPSLEHIQDANFSSRLSISQRILKLLRCLALEFPYDPYDTELLHSVATFADTLPSLFRLRFDFSNHDWATGGDRLGALVLQILEDFLHFIHIIFYEDYVCYTVQTCVVASMMEILNSKNWRYDESSSSLKPPLIYCPQVVLYLLKLLKDVKSWTSPSDILKKSERKAPDCSHESEISVSFCHVRSKRISLLKNYTCEEYLRLIFPESEQWVDDLVHLAFFLHAEGVKSRPVVDKLRSTSTKPAIVSDSECSVSHEDEAIFGNLFSEASRPTGPTDGLDQPVTLVTSTSSSPRLPIQAATDLLSFLKTCVFSPDWHCMIFEDAWIKLQSFHIDQLLSILNCPVCFSGERNSEDPVQITLLQINEICFELLHTLLVRHDLPTSLKVHLIDQVLKVEDGMYVYNHLSLTLVAHALISGSDSDGNLQTKIIDGYFNFVLEKAKNILGICSESTDFFGTLPCAFHLEILLMAFHLSSEDKKPELAKFVLSSLREVGAPPPGTTAGQLSRWGLLISRLLLPLRHMILYPSTCPSWLLLRLRSKLREVPFIADQSYILHDHLPSCASAVVQSIFGDSIKESSVVSSLLPQLIDVTPLHATIYRGNDTAFQKLGLDFDDLSTTFSQILSFWRGKKPEAAEHLIVERYVFLLCWGTISSISFSTNSTSHGVNLVNLDFSDVRSACMLGLSFVRGTAVNSQDNDFPACIFDLLQQFHPQKSIDSAEVGSWDFLRNNVWLSFILLLLNAGFWRNSKRNTISEMESYWLRLPKDCKLFDVGESLVMYILQGNKGGWLLDVLSSILKTYLQVLRESFLSTVDVGACAAHFSPLLLFKLSAIDKFGQKFPLEKYGCSISQLEDLYDLPSKLDGIASKFDTGGLNFILCRCLLHGFPSHSDCCSGALLSCILEVREIVCILDGYLKIRGAEHKDQVEAGVVTQLLENVMTVKTDKIFRSISGQCDSICTSLIGQRNDLAGYCDLFALKQLEGFLANISFKDDIDTVMQEALVASIVDLIDDLRRDNSGMEISKYYLGSDEGVPEEFKVFFGGYHANLSVLFDALDKCHSEPINLKVLNLFTGLLADGLCPSLKEKLHKKFLEMELSRLSHWLEFRLLGCSKNLGSVAVTAGSPVLREATMEFIMRLVYPSGDTFTRELLSRLVEAMLILLDRAFLHYDLLTGKAYFNFLVQLLSGEPFMKQLLESTVMLVQKLVDSEGSLPALKFLFGFLDAVMNDYRSNKSSSDKHSLKQSLSDSSSLGSVVPKQVSSRKNTENLLLTANQERGSASADCDATSADEDEDDGTSDGELGSIDRDDEEDSNSERALASKVCTFTSSGSNFMEQHWYFCYTCDLTVSKGCCSICAKVCHRGHRVVYSRSSRFFCDCGAGGVRGSSCQCLKPRKFTGPSSLSAPATSNFQPLLPYSEDADQAADSDSDLDDNMSGDVDNCFNLSIPLELHDRLPVIIENLNIEGRLLELCNKLLPTVIAQRELNLSKDKKVILGGDKMVSHNADMFQLKKAYKSGSLDLKIKADYPNSRELKSHLVSGSLTKSLLSVSVRGRLAAGEGDKVAIFDVGQLIGQPTVAPVTADKTNVKPLSRNIVRFEIIHLLFNPLVENYLAVAGYEDCQVLTLNSRGEVTDRLAIELALQGAYIRRVEWVPGSQVQLMVVTNMFVKIYDLSQDNISPMHYFNLADDLIVDATLVPASMGKVFLLVLSETGCLFRLEVSMEGDVGAKTLTETIKVKDAAEVQQKGLSLYFSSTYRLLFLAYQDNTTLMGRLDANATSLTESSYVYEEDQDGKVRPAGLHHWKELVVGSGIFVSLSSLKSNSPLAVSLGLHELAAQNMRYGSVSTTPMVGVAAYKPLSKDKIHCLVLHDDGSLQIYSYTPIGGDTAAGMSVEQTKKLGSSILSSRAYAGSNPEFPLDFFEKTMCITPDVKLSSDAIRSGDSDSIKQKLASDDGFLESPTPAGFKVTVSNSNPDIVMVGCRIHVGNGSAIHIPSEVTIFQRAVKLDEGMRSWYDIPFTTAESLLADEEFTITIGRTLDGSANPRIDSLEVYGRAKDEFGWKEKMDAVLDMEAHVLGTSSGAGRLGKRYQMMHAAPIQEQVLADALKFLSRIYMLCRSNQSTEVVDVDSEVRRLKCRTLLETVFQSDREPLLQSAACHVLRAVFPKREIYYHVKDTMRLLGVIKSFPMLISRIGVGGAASGWVIKEFTAQMHAVSKIALHRRANMATFLETHGSEVVDGLMQILWGILDLERPETQTINSIVIPSVELIYSYAECLALHANDAYGLSVAPAVALLKKLLFAPYEAVQTSSSLAISSRLLQVPFPKQTMIPTDDAVENRTVAHVLSENPTGGNTQVMIEEDHATSSVQYCCDGCSTVPILRQRWHCNVCPDFDLCEACYRALDADRLPPPHSRDHPMSAIPIEIDSLGGESSNEIHFPMDELSDPSVMHVAADRNMQNSPSSIHVLETNEAGDFPSSVTDQRIVSISASKRAVNSLLLHQLIEDLNGWMEITAGIRAIPIMQLFYRLSSAVGGPFMDSSKPENLDMEKFVKWLLDEINVNKPFPAKTRCYFGEVAILVFMFFTLMFRNWHHPGGDVSQPKSGGSSDLQDKGFVQAPLSSSSSSAVPSSSDEPEKNEFASQLVRACSFLRQQAFLNYLMDILQQLVPIFKSSSSNSESGSSAGSGCGSLLTVRRELPAGNFSPFFSDSYAKAHRADLFTDYHKLLLENTFRLVYSMVRPEKQDKSGDKDKMYKSLVAKDLKLDGFQDVLCSYISNPLTTFVRRYARRLFLHLCGSKTHYYSVRDSWQFSYEIRKLHKLVNKSGGFRNPVPYERSVKLVKSLSAICEVAGARPRNWQKFCLKNMDLLPFLMNGMFYFGEESVVQTLKLLNLAFHTGKEVSHGTQKSEGGDAGGYSNRTGSQSSDSKKKRKGEDGGESGSEKSCVDMEQAVEMFIDKDGTILRRFIDSFLLEWNSASVRHEAKCVLYGVWHHGKSSFREAVLTTLFQKVKSLPMYGQNIVEYTELMTWLLGKMADSSIKHHEKELVSKCLTSDVISCIFETLHSQNDLLANHPNSRIYNTLNSLVEFDGYYLESEPCVTCSCPDVPYARIKLESLKSETKFTDNRIIVKCTGSYTIQSVTMNVHDARKSKSVKILNLYYNNRPVSDLSELKNNWSLWKRAKSCHLAFNQTELKVEFPIPITACNFMIELDSFYENLQASSLESLQCPRCSRSVTDKHGICGNCHENAYQCRQCRNINYENLDSFLCNECGYSKYGRFEFNFMAKPSFSFDNMENDEDMRKGLAAIESESENAHRRYQQLLGFKKPLLKLVSSIGEQEIDSQQKDTVQQMMVSLPGPSCKVNRKIALLGVLYGEKCKAAFDSVSKSVQTLQGLRRVLMAYLHQKNSDDSVALSTFAIPRSPSNCYGCATTFVTQCLELLQVLSKHPNCKKQLVSAGILSELFENNLHQGPKTSRVLARAVLSAFCEGDAEAVGELNRLIQKKVMYCLEHHRSMDIALATREELLLLSETCAVVDELWESRLRVAFQLMFSSIKVGAKHPAISEHIILPCLRIISQACTPPRSDANDKENATGKSTSLLQPKNDSSSNQSATSTSLLNGNRSPSELSEKSLEGSQMSQDIPLLSYSEWERGASYLDFVRRQYKVSQVVKATAQKSRQDPQKFDYLALKYGLKWKRRACRRTAKNDFSTFALGSWVSELILSACSQSIRSEVCNLIALLCPLSSSRGFQLLNLLTSLLPATLSVGESATEYFELLFKMIESEAARLFLTVRGCLKTICRLIKQEVANVESQERSLSIDISQGLILHKLIELLNKFLEIPNIRARFMQDELLSEVLEAFLVIRGLIVQKTKLISDCNRLLKDLLDSLLQESTANKRQFIRACISSLQNHAKEKKGRSSLFILEQLCNMICPTKPEPVYLLILNKAHTQEEFIRGSMTKNPYSSAEIGPLMRDVKNKICNQLDLVGLLEDDYGMELLVGGNIISLDLSISQVYEQVWKKYHSQTQSSLPTSAVLSSAGLPSARECPPMTVTYRLQGLDGEATEPMIKELEEEREESQDPEVEFAIAGVVRECEGLETIMSMIQRLRDDDLRSNQEELNSVLNLLMYCCKIRENRQALLRLGALGLLLDTARRAFSVDAMEPAEGILLIVESLTLEANESDISSTQSVFTVSNEESGAAGEQAKKIVLMFLERLCHPLSAKKSNKQQRNDEMVARILPYLTYGQPVAMEALIQHFEPYLQAWGEFDELQKKHQDNPKDESLAQQAAKQRSALENFVRVSESLKTSSCGESLKDIILERGIVKAAITHLKESFAVAGQAGYKTSSEWTFGLKLPSVPLILSMLRGLSKGHLPTQRCIDEEGVLPLLHALEGVSGENEIGTRAENLLDTLANKENNGDGFLGQKIRELRHATRDEMRRMALKNREMLLQGLGMRQEFSLDGGKRIVVSKPAIEGLDDVEEEEDGLACMVCREGYTLRPNDMLGVYSFSKRVNLGPTNTASGGRGDCVYTTVSHFNIIHFQCHQEAKRADAALKNPKKEWEGATLRNNETLCNCIFPLRGPSVPLAQYARCVDQYWEHLNTLGRADGSRLRLVTYDIVLMLARFATGASFSTDSKGGGRESNSRFLPFMIQMASYLVNQGSSNQQQRRAMAKSVASYLSSSSSSNNNSPSSSPSSTTSSSDSPGRSPSSSLPGPARPPSEETVQFMMVYSLLSDSYEDWSSHRLAFLQRGIYHAFMQHKHSGRSSSTLRSPSDSAAASTSRSDDGGPSADSADAKKLFALVQPILVYTGLIEQLQQFFKLGNSSSSSSSSSSSTAPGEEAGSSGSGSLERWEVVMKERMVNMKEMVGFSKEMLDWLEDMTTAADLQEAFDVMGVLRDVLSGGFSRCEDFVREAILAAKS